MTFKVTVHLNTNEIKRNHGLEKNGAVNRHLRNTVDRFCDPYIPMNIGELKMNKRYPDNSTIQYISPHARYVYHGKLMLAPNGSSWAKKGEKKHLTGIDLNFQGSPMRGAFWEKRMMNARRQDVIQDLQKYIDGG